MWRNKMHGKRYLKHNGNSSNILGDSIKSVPLKCSESGRIAMLRPDQISYNNLEWGALDLG